MEKSGVATRAFLVKKYNSIKAQLKADFLTTLFWKINLNFLLLFQILVIFFLYRWNWLNILTFELTVLLRVLFLLGQNCDKKFWFQYIFSRGLTFWLASTEAFDLPWYLGFFCFPIGLTWYLFEPYLIMAGQRYNERFDYFLSRFPFFFFLGFIPNLFYLFEFWTGLYISLILLTHHQNCDRDKRPQYAYYIPYTTNKYDLDPFSLGENMVANIV